MAHSIRRPRIDLGDLQAEIAALGSPAWRLITAGIVTPEPRPITFNKEPRVEKKKDQKKGIFCLEGHWWGVKGKTTVEPVRSRFLLRARSPDRAAAAERPAMPSAPVAPRSVSERA